MHVTRSGFKPTTLARDRIRTASSYWVRHCSRIARVMGRVFELCVNNKPVKVWARLVIKVAREWWKKEHPCSNTLRAFRCIVKGFSWSLFIIICVSNYLFLKNCITYEGAVSYNVLYYQQLSIARYQVSFCTNNYFEWIPIVSSALRQFVKQGIIASSCRWVVKRKVLCVV